MKCNILRIWRLFFMKIANNRKYIHKFCNNPGFLFQRLCCEWYFYIPFKNDDFNSDFNNNIFLDKVHFDDDDNDNFPVKRTKKSTYVFDDKRCYINETESISWN